MVLVLLVGYVEMGVIEMIGPPHWSIQMLMNDGMRFKMNDSVRFMMDDDMRCKMNEGVTIVINNGL